jgi:hypothetical protein
MEDDILTRIGVGRVFEPHAGQDKWQSPPAQKGNKGGGR